MAGILTIRRCLPSALFCKERGHNRSKLNKLYSSPLNNWTSATTNLREHITKSEFHTHSAPLAARFRSYMEEKVQPTQDGCVSSWYLSGKNIKKLSSLVKTLILVENRIFHYKVIVMMPLAM